ncbi:hypothetical protein [Aeromonas tecta]|uniref:hypothetical protein n=1 Tax=Aeromonas tecta TaxID=324617 RepID=UPI000682F5EF|nr:hypothetical protein [Aeromonas tecta]
MPRYRNKPVEIEALQWTGHNLTEIQRLVKPCHLFFDQEGMKFRTAIGTIPANIGDFIVKAVDGSCCPCPPKLFAAVYERVTPEQQPDAQGGGS